MTSSFKNLTINDTGYLQAAAGSTTQRVDTHTVTTFTSVGTTSWTAPTDVTSVEVLVVAGGGAGGGSNGAGGGAGGVIYNASYAVTAGTSYTVTVGNGGTIIGSVRGNNGGNSVFDVLTAVGGGAGAYWSSGVGSNGGSGGGGSNNGAGGSATQTGSYNYGTAGGSGYGTSPFTSGGGGGASEAGQNGGGNYVGNGGRGIFLSITGTPTWYAGGGGGGAAAGGAGRGGPGGGGDGASGTNLTGVSGTANTGGGGGGGSDGAGGVGGAGGSGIVVLKYKQVKTFTSTGSTTWTVPAGVTSAEVLVVAGGGGGGGGNPDRGSGGGGGLYYTPHYSLTPGDVLNVTVGAGGAAGSSANGSNGGNSLFGTSTNQLTNGTFASATGWSVASNITINTGSNNVTYSSPTHGNNLQRTDIAFSAGKTYILQFTISSYTSGSLTLYYNYTTGTTALVASQAVTGNGNGTYYFMFTPTSNGTGFTFQANSVTYGAANFNLSNVIIYDTSNTILTVGGGSGGSFGGGGAYGGSGGSGGGGDAGGSPNPGTAGTGIAGQGHSAGASATLAGAIRNTCGGGGGAGGPGGPAHGSTGGHGGAGFGSNITGVFEYYAGGGGGGSLNGLGAPGGSGVGGAGGSGATSATAGVTNTGSGGGGGLVGGAGADGIVIISYSSNRLPPGASRFNSTTNHLEIWNGNQWIHTGYLNQNNVPSSSISNLVSYWPLNKESFAGGYFKDYASGYHLRLLGPGNTTYTSEISSSINVVPDSRFGTVVQFNRDYNNSYLRSESWRTLASGSAMTVSFWFRSDSTLNNGTTGNQWVISEGPVNGRWNIFFEPQLKWRSSGGGDVQTSSQNYLDGNWHHAVLTHNGSSGNIVNIYIDGKLVKTGASIANTFQGNFLLVGQHSSLLGNNNSYYWRGWLTQMRIYDKVLSQSEVNTLYGEF